VPHSFSDMVFVVVRLMARNICHSLLIAMCKTCQSCCNVPPVTAHPLHWHRHVLLRGQTAARDRPGRSCSDEPSSSWGGLPAAAGDCSGGTTPWSCGGAAAVAAVAAAAAAHSTSEEAGGQVSQQGKHWAMALEVRWHFIVCLQSSNPALLLHNFNLWTIIIH